jgi:hypothetical protein
MIELIRQVAHLPVPWYIATGAICVVEVLCFIAFGRWKDDGRSYDEEEEML